MKKIVILILILLAQSTFSVSPLTEDADDYCSKDSLKKPNLSSSEREDLYDSRDNDWYGDYKEIITFLKDPENNPEDWFDVIKWESALLIIFMSVVFICFIIFIVACCTCRGKRNSVKACTAMGCLCFWIFLALFITALVFFSMSEDIAKDFLCSVFKMPSGAIDGINDSENKFIGLANLKSTFSSLKSELPNLSVVQNNLNSIIQKDIQSLSNETWMKSLDFYNTHKKSEIVDAVGVYSKPSSVLILQEGINTQIASEINKLDSAAEKLNKGALEGKNLAQNAPSTDITLNKFISRLSPMIDAIEEFGESSVDNFRTSSRYARYGYGFMVGFGILSIILFIFLYIIMCNMCKDKCWNYLKCGKVLVIILSFLLLIYLILIFNMMIGVSSLSGICGFLQKFTQNSKKSLDEFPEINSDVRKFVETCMVENATGDLESLLKPDTFEKIHFKQITRLLDGLSSYRKWKNDTSTSTTSKAIEDQKIVWDQHELAYYTDFKNVNEKLEELNEMVNCSEERYVLTKDNCGNETNNCNNIYDSGLRPPISVPSCVENKSAVKLLYDNLQDYQNQEVGLMNKFQVMVTEISNPESVQSKFKLAKDSLFSSNDDVSKVEGSMSGSLKYTREMDINWMGLDDCRVLKMNLLQFEEIGCFRVNYYFYIYFVVSCVCACLWFLMLWCACCAFRSPGDEDSQPREEPAPKPREEDLDVDDKEKMPFY